MKEEVQRSAWVVEQEGNPDYFILGESKESVLTSIPVIFEVTTDNVRPATLDEVLTNLSLAKKAYSALSKEADEAKSHQNVLVNMVIGMMDQAGITTAGNDCISVSVGSDIMPTVEDWEKVFEYVKENDAWHVLQKRISAGAYRELLNMGEKVPGIKPFDKAKLNSRAK